MTQLTTLYAELKELAVSDVKNEQLDNADLEKLNEHADLWYDILVELKREVELQLTDKRREFSAKASELSDEEFMRYKIGYNSWRVKVLRFLVSIESKVRYVKRVRSDYYE
jgi:hypothetical protein